MIATQAEIDMVRRTFNRRMMRLPLTREQDGAINPCPARRGRTYKLQTRGSAKGQVAITIIDRRREKLGALSLADARREGHDTIQDALDAFRKAHGDHEEVWVITFARDKDDDVAAFLSEERPLYLGRSVGLTFDRSRAAAREPEMLMPLEKDLAKARKRALERRLTPQQESVSRMQEEAGALLRAMTAMKDRNRLKLIAKELDKLAAKLSVENGGTLAPVAPAESQAPVAVEDGPRPDSSCPLMSLEPAA